MTKSEIFTRAWRMAREAAQRHSENKRVVFGSVQIQNEGIFLKASQFFAECLKTVYVQIKKVIAIPVIAEPVNSINYSGATMNAAQLAVIDMMRAGDRRSAYDSIEG